MSYAVMPLTDYVAACDAVREKTGSTDTIKSGEMPDKINDVFKAGQFDVVSCSECLKGSAKGTSVTINDISPVEHNVSCTVESKNIFNGELKIWRDADRIMPKECIKVKRNTWYRITAYDYTITEPTFACYGNNTGVIGDGTDTHLASNSSWHFYTKEFDYVWFRQWNDMTQAGITLDCKVQIEEVEGENSPATDFAPYIEDLSSVTVKRFSKNLSNLGTFEVNRTYTTDLPYVLPAGTYTVSGILDTTYPKDYALIQFQYTDDTWNSKTGFYVSNKERQSATVYLSKPVKRLSIHAGPGYAASAGHTANYTDFMIERGSTATEFEPYIEPTEHSANADGTVEGVRSLYPNMTLIPDTEGVIISAEYIKDIDKAFEAVTTAVALTGGE